MAHKTLVIIPTRNACGISGTDVGIAKPDLQKRTLVNCITKAVVLFPRNLLLLLLSVSVVPGQY